jgi:hypothetical protein
MRATNGRPPCVSFRVANLLRESPTAPGRTATSWPDRASASNVAVELASRRMVG